MSHASLRHALRLPPWVCCADARGDGDENAASAKETFFLWELCESAGVPFVMVEEDEEDEVILIDDLDDEMLDDPWQREGQLGALNLPKVC
jgi:hypothetical protein